VDRTYTQIVVFALLLCCYALTSAEVIDFTTGATDLGRHLKNGELLLSGSSGILRTNFYSYTQPDFEFINHHWLADVIFFLAWKAGDFEGLNAIYILLGGVAFGLFFRIAQKAAGLPVAVALAACLMPSLRARPSVRPEIFTLLLSGVFLYILWNHYQGRLSWRSLLILPVLEALWVNLHLGFILGPAFIGAFLLADLPRFKRWAPILLLTVAVTLLNPNGLRGATYPFTVWTNYGFDVIENYSILRIEKTVYASYYRLMELTLAALFVSFIVAARRSKRFPLPTFALALLIGGMAWWAVRAEPLLALFSLSAIAINIGPVSVRWPVAMAALGLVILAGLSYNGWRSLRKSAPIGLGLKPGSNLAAELLRDSGLDGPILNNFNIGGYLIYYLFPQHRVFMDSRPEAYSAAFIREKYQMPFENEDQWNQLLDEYKFNVICFARATTAENRFIRRRVADPAWAPVFYDGGIVILVRRTPSNSSFIQAHIIPQALLPSMTQ